MACIVLNLKAYAESAGQKNEPLLLAAKQASETTTHEIIVCSHSLDLANSLKLYGNVFSQHVDPNSAGAFTGSMPIALLKAMGVNGSLLNHSEKRVPKEIIAATLVEAKKYNFKIILCARDAQEGAALAKLGPWAIAVEPPELIGSGISVSTARPEAVTDSVKLIKAVAPQVKVLAGAGVSNAGDFRKSLELGAEGVLLASAFVKAKDPVAFLKEFG